MWILIVKSSANVYFEKIKKLRIKKNIKSSTDMY